MITSKYLCFSYPKDQSKSHMFFSSTIRSIDVAETLRTTDPIQLCATQLRKECVKTDHNLGTISSTRCSLIDTNLQTSQENATQSIQESIYDTCRSNNLITNMSRLSMSYEGMERLDINLAHRTIDSAGQNRVPIPCLKGLCPAIQGAMENFDNEENTSSGIGGSYDTILMLFQNIDKEYNMEPP